VLLLTAWVGAAVWQRLRARRSGALPEPAGALPEPAGADDMPQPATAPPALQPTTIT